MTSRAADRQIDHRSAGTTDPAGTTGSAALSARRWFLVASPVLAGLFAVLGAASDPAVGEDGLVLWRAYAENPDALQFKAFGLHWAFAFWLVPPLLIAGLVRSRGVWIANVAAFCPEPRPRRRSTRRWRACGACPPWPSPA